MLKPSDHLPSPRSLPTSINVRTVSSAQMRRALQSSQAFEELTGLAVQCALVAFETDYRSEHLTGAAALAHGHEHRTGAWAWKGHHRGEMRGQLGLGFGILTTATSLQSEVRTHDIISSVQAAIARAEKLKLSLVLLLPTQGQARQIQLNTWLALLPPCSDLQIYLPETGEWTHDQ